MNRKDNSLKKANTLPRASEKLYKLLIDSVKDYAIFMLDPTGSILTWNTGAERIKGYSSEEIIGKHFSTFYLPEEQEVKLPQLELQIASKEGKFEAEGWRVRKDGHLLWANIIITAMHDEHGELIGFSKVTRDLTERKSIEDELTRTNQALKASEIRYRLLIESARDYAILMLTTEGHIATWNIGAERIKGYTLNEVLGKHFSVFYPLQAVEQGFPDYELRKALEDGRFEDEGWRVRKDGTLFWANVIITALFDDQQAHIGYSKITRDLTQRLRSEELTKKNRELLRINTDLDNFIYTASHDLMSPIANLEGLIRLIDSKLENKITTEEQEVLEMMDSSVDRLRQTIKGLAEITKSQRNHEEGIEAISIREVWEGVKQDLAMALTEASTSIEEGFIMDQLVISRASLQSILYNLLSNAIKYRQPNRPLNVHIASFLKDTHQVLSIRDNGLGLSPSQKAKLFSMFKRFHTHIEGTGVGLYIVKRVVESNNGRIEIETEVNQGSEFIMYFPLNKPAE